MTSKFSNLQYQSFPDAPGMVDSSKKLQAFQLPQLYGKSFLDIGCNEGFYCGYASSQGANRVVGIDSYLPFLERARTRFPSVEFIHSSWDYLPNEKFDVILFSSAMHYISTYEDVLKLFKSISERMHENSLLVVETGINADLSTWLKVERHDGSLVYYPSLDIFESLAINAGLIHRFIGLSEPGDQIRRSVFHCNKFKRIFNFVTGDSSDGKTRFCYFLNRGYRSDNYINIDKVGVELYGHILADSDYDLDQYNPLELVINELLKVSQDHAVGVIADYIYRKLMKLSSDLFDNNLKDVILIDGLKDSDPTQLLIKKNLISRIGDSGICWVSTKI